MQLSSIALLVGLGSWCGLGCSLPRAALGRPDGGASELDASSRDAGDVGMADAVSIDAGPGVDAATPDAALPDTGPVRCNHDPDCGPDLVTDGACTYADACTTSGTMMRTTTHFTCDAHDCTPHVTTTPASCTRTTDGDACGTRVCDPCDATMCGATGAQRCMTPVCEAGACSMLVTGEACTTPDDRCGNPAWGRCHGNIGSSTCTQERLWGRCVLGGCTPAIGQLESRDCPC